MVVEGSTVKSHHKVSAEAVQARLVAQYTDGLLLLSEVPVVGQIRLVYQRIGQRKYPAEQEGSSIEGLKEEGLHIVIVTNQTILKLIGLLRTYII